MNMTNRFSSLKTLRQERSESDIDEPDVLNLDNPGETDNLDVNNSTNSSEQAIEATFKRPIGRPPGRRSNPDYTQISAYIPIEVLQEVQDVLAQERRKSKKRTPRPVSDLVEELLSEWLKIQKLKSTGT
jgi:hypothetical protein